VTSSPAPRRTGRGRLKALSGSAVIAVALGVVGLGYTAVAAPSRTRRRAGRPRSRWRCARARRLYDVGCSTCHGLNLQGGAGGPSLIGVGAAAVIYQVESGRMPLHAGVQQAPRKTPKYTLEEIDQLAAYIQANGGGPEIPDGDLTDGDLQHGRRPVPHQLRQLPQLRRLGRRPHLRQVRPELGPPAPA
jgi:ubiquinol-cytochrome c reductase cytochrome c subunit